nr:MAG TPA: hypothetical protein [Caudoviricetes sp.]DAH76225.1 MAG TPA: hypothetical protein [Caudoviricetes sp.]
MYTNLSQQMSVDTLLYQTMQLIKKLFIGT